MRLKIDFGRMLLAIEWRPYGTRELQDEDTGYLNRQTGEIVFLSEDEGEAVAIYGDDVAVDMVFDRAEVESRPELWIEIPRDYCPPDDDDEVQRLIDECVAEFLRKHGIEAELV